MYKAWVYMSLACSLCVTANQNVTIDDLNTSIVLSPLAMWAWSDQGSGLSDGTFSFSNDESASVTFTFPTPAVAVYWQGFKRSGAALYSLCIDCTGDPNDPSFVAVDGHDANAQLDDSVTTLFSKTGLSNTVHNVTIQNHIDPRFSGVSQITLDSIILTISTDAQTSLTFGAPPASTSMPVGSSETSGTTETAMKSVTPAVTETAASTTTATGSTRMVTPPSMDSLLGLDRPTVIGIAVVGSVVTVVVVLALLWWFRRKHKRYSKVGTFDLLYISKRGEPVSPMTGTFNLPPRDAEQNSMVSYAADPFADPWEASTLSTKRPSKLQRLSSWVNLPLSPMKVNSPLMKRASNFIGYPSSATTPSSPYFAWPPTPQIYEEKSLSNRSAFSPFTPSAPTPNPPRRYPSMTSSRSTHSHPESTPFGISNPFAVSLTDVTTESHAISPVDRERPSSTESQHRIALPWQREQSPRIEGTKPRTSMRAEPWGDSPTSAGIEAPGLRSGPRGAPGRGDRHASDTLSVPSAASLRVSGIVADMQDVMVPGSGHGRLPNNIPTLMPPPPLGQRSRARSPVPRPIDSRIRHIRVPSSSPTFF